MHCSFDMATFLQLLLSIAFVNDDIEMREIQRSKNEKGDGDDDDDD